jgi:indolepyruvate ferredoxin oxidoreductase beta subunit
MLQEVTRKGKTQARPTLRITGVLVGAIGGQGGNVLIEWLFLAAEKDGKRAQALSLPGLSQRGGATTFYMEIASAPSGSEALLEKTVFGQHPIPGRVEVVVGQELLELGRMAQQGYISRSTSVIGNSQRLYTIGEKMPAFDGIYPSEKIIEAVSQLAGSFTLVDAAEIARQQNLGDLSANAIMLGVLSAMPGALPMSAEAYRQAIREFGLAVEMNLKAFEAGREFQLSLAEGRTDKAQPAQEAPKIQPEPFKPVTDSGVAADSGDPVARKPKRQISLTPVQKPGKGVPLELPELVKQRSETLPPKMRPAFEKLAEYIRQEFPEALQRTIIEASYQLSDYQDVKYARRYLDEVETVLKLDRAGPGWKLTETFARTLAMRATYEDAVRVACLKIQQGRFARIRQDMKLKDGQVLVLTDFLKPDAYEIYGIFPAALVKPVLFMGKVSGIGKWAEKKHFTLPLHPRPNTFTGFATFVFLTWFKPYRPISYRANQEWKHIREWAKQIARFASVDYELALLVADSGKMVKGYGDTRCRMFEAHPRYLNEIIEPLAKWEDKHRDKKGEISYPLTLALGKRALRLVGMDDRGIEWAAKLYEWAKQELKNGKNATQVIAGLETQAKFLSTRQ